MVMPIFAVITCLGRKGLCTALRKRIWGSAAQQVECEPAMCSYSPESQLHPGLHQKKHDQQGEGGGPAPLLFTCEISLGVLHPDVESSVQERVQISRGEQETNRKSARETREGENSSVLEYKTVGEKGSGKGHWSEVLVIQLQDWFLCFEEEIRLGHVLHGEYLCVDSVLLQISTVCYKR
ncbi:uncharacterized protein [Excalfactoria chinensis]|uniref:uncharacterized protein isoform X1 n=1 Tax=Excalfactoria chinensis TaxID=46218 RepID=UPI003B3A172B